MTTQEINLYTGFYLVLLGVVIFFTRPTARRVVGALAGGGVYGLVALGEIALGESLELWKVPMERTWYYLPLMYVSLAVSLAPILLVTWRIARRFGWRGLTVVLVFLAVIGPPRDYTVAAMFPEWIVFGPGVAPIIAVSAVYVGIVAVGQPVMRLVAGPARGDRLAARPWEPA